METEDSLHIIDEYADGMRLLRSAFTGYARESWDHTPMAGAWSLRQILAHLCDHELHIAVRMRFLLAEPGTTILAYDQDAWCETLDYAGEDPITMLELMDGLRRSSTQLLRRCNADIWTKTLVHPQGGPQTLAQFLPRQHNHLQVHLRQMERTYLAWVHTQSSYHI